MEADNEGVVKKAEYSIKIGHKMVELKKNTREIIANFLKSIDDIEKLEEEFKKVV